ncbi:MAG: hypothetical protein WCA38_11995 [Candidatus Acidiferrales bacterium]
MAGDSNSPFYAGWAPFGFGYGYGLYGNRYYHHFGNDNRSWDTRGYYAGGAQSGRGGFPGWGFRGGHAGGGFHGGSAGGGSTAEAALAVTDGKIGSVFITQ